MMLMTMTMRLRSPTVAGVAVERRGSGYRLGFRDVSFESGVPEFRGLNPKPVLVNLKARTLLPMIQILRYLQDPKLWELWYIPSYG